MAFKLGIIEFCYCLIALLRIKCTFDMFANIIYFALVPRVVDKFNVGVINGSSYNLGLANFAIML